MIPEQLQGVWTHQRLIELVGLSAQDSTEASMLCKVLNDVQKPRDLRISHLTKVGRQVLVEFGDGSGLTLELTPFLKMIQEFLSNQENYIALMEYNRSHDPRVTGEWDNAQSQIRELQREVENFRWERRMRNGGLE